jgi:hypothetical protein
MAGTRIVVTPLPAAHFGAGSLGALPGIVRGTGAQGWPRPGLAAPRVPAGALG